MAQPPGRHSVNPYYVVDDAPAFIAFLVDVLDALTAGSRSIMAPTDQAWGERVAGVYDPFDNRWWLASPIDPFG